MIQLPTATAATAMIAMGYSLTSPEYLAVQRYAAQIPQPQYVWIGLQDLTSLSDAAGATVIDVPGTNYTQGDIVAVSQGSPANITGEIEILTVSAGGIPTSIAVLVLNNGTGYSPATGLATVHVSVTNPAAAGLTISLTAVGESPLDALTNNRVFSNVWYGYYSTTAADADAKVMAAFAQSASPVMKFYYNSSTSTIPTFSTSDVASYCDANNYDRIEIGYATTQGGNAPNNAYWGAASMGMEMGLNTGLPNSWFAKFGQTLVGITPEPLSESQKGYLVSKNCNFYANFGPFPMFYSGVMSDGVASSVILFDDVLVYQIQYNIMNDIKENGAYTLDDPGEQRAIHQVNLACQAVDVLGALDSGIWMGPSFQPPLNLVNGQYIPGGYLTQALPMALLSQSARAARALQPIICAIIQKEGAISVQVGVYVQQGA
jgi:hypothetical protein